MNDGNRERIADDQRRLLDALCGGSAPAGFDAARLTLTARTLRNKRARSLARRWPELARIADFDARFDAFVAAVPTVAGDSDGERFFNVARSNGGLPDALVTDWALRKARLRGVVITRLDERGKWLVAVGVPWPIERAVSFRI